MIPYVQQWNFGLGFQWGNTMGLEINYVGNKSTNLFGPSAVYNAINLQQYTADYVAGVNLTQTVPNPQGIKGANGQVTAPVQFQNTLRPLSTVGDITDPTFEGYDSRYNALQVNFNKRFSAGFQFNISYVWMKAMDDMSCMGQFCTNQIQNWGTSAPQLLGDPAPDSHKLEKSISAYDIPNDLKLNYNWDLPVGRGKQFLNAQRGWVNSIIGNWKTSGNLEERSGYPFSVYSNTAAGWPDDVKSIRPNINAGVNPILPNWKANCDNVLTQICPYLNSLALFTPPAFLSLGNAPRVTNIRMPHVQRYNMAIMKEIPVREGIRLVLRGELYGALNHASFSTNGNNFTLYQGLTYTNGILAPVTANNIQTSFANVSSNIIGTRTVRWEKLYF